MQIVALRGDALKTETYFKPEKDGNEYATDLVLQINNLNNGIYLDEDLQNSACTNFCIGGDLNISFGDNYYYTEEGRNKLNASFCFFVKLFTTNS